jgi:hypothetical protein
MLGVFGVCVLENGIKVSFFARCNQDAFAPIKLLVFVYKVGNVCFGK